MTKRAKRIKRGGFSKYIKDNTFIIGLVLDERIKERAKRAKECIKQISGRISNYTKEYSVLYKER